MEERRNISRVDYAAKGVIVVCDTGDKYFVDTKNVSPLGMGIIAPADLSDIRQGHYYSSKHSYNVCGC